MNEYSLAHLKVLPLIPRRVDGAAARAGCRYVSLGLNRVTPSDPLYPLIADRPLMRETRARLADTGVGVLDVELARMDPGNDARNYLPLLEATNSAPAMSSRNCRTGIARVRWSTSPETQPIQELSERQLTASRVRKTLLMISQYCGSSASARLRTRSARRAAASFKYAI